MGSTTAFRLHEAASLVAIAAVELVGWAVQQALLDHLGSARVAELRVAQPALARDGPRARDLTHAVGRHAALDHL